VTHGCASRCPCCACLRHSIERLCQVRVNCCRRSGARRVADLRTFRTAARIADSLNTLDSLGVCKAIIRRLPPLDGGAGWLFLFRNHQQQCSEVGGLTYPLVPLQQPLCSLRFPSQGYLRMKCFLRGLQPPWRQPSPRRTKAATHGRWYKSRGSPTLFVGLLEYDVAGVKTLSFVALLRSYLNCRTLFHLPHFTPITVSVCAAANASFSRQAEHHSQRALTLLQLALPNNRAGNARWPSIRSPSESS
jgi:hypothetical protein